MDGAFENNKNIEKVYLLGGATSVGSYAFRGCASLEYVYVGEGVKQIGEYAFCLCDNIESIVIPESVKFIGNRAFQHCSILREVTLNEGLETIGESAFNFCRELTSIHIPTSVNLIETPALGECNKLENITIGVDNEHYTVLNGNLYNKDETSIIKYASGKSDEYFIIPNEIVCIEEGTFLGCEYLLGVVIPTSVIVIEDEFKYCDKLDCFYAGTRQQWNQIHIEELTSLYGDDHAKKTVYFYSETAPTVEGNFWHYVDGVPTPWTLDDDVVFGGPWGEWDEDPWT